MIREVILVAETKCNGCGACITGCYEGALQIIDGKAVLVGDLMCDGLGACIGGCAQGALTIERREAQPYDEAGVMKTLISKGKKVVVAQLEQLRDHGEFGYLEEGLRVLRENKVFAGFDFSETALAVHGSLNGIPHKNEEGRVATMHQCPGSRSVSFGEARPMVVSDNTGSISPPSLLTHWPVQLHLVNPLAEHFRGADLLLAADCVAYAMGDFHYSFLRGRKLLIACPKLDSGLELYMETLCRLIDEARVNSITAVVMEVPCCSGLIRLLAEARSKTAREVTVKKVVVSTRGEVLVEEWS